MTTPTAIILAAGRGSRMRELTDTKPKCLLELAGRPLLHWQLDALRDAGVERIVLVRGYAAHTLVGDFETVDNPRWNETNMVQTLLCALPHVHGDVLVCYADIVYKKEHVQALLRTQGDICLTYDTKWESLWRLRNENPLDDAETFLSKDGKLLTIGGKAQSFDQVHGQYMGLLKFSPTGQQTVAQHVASLPSSEADKLDMTSLLRQLLGKNIGIRVCAVSGGWCECDTKTDIEHYEQKIQDDNCWSHDWR